MPLLESLDLDNELRHDLFWGGEAKRLVHMLAVYEESDIVIVAKQDIP